MLSWLADVDVGKVAQDRRKELQGFVPEYLAS
jgi:hypothetical protein